MVQHYFDWCYTCVCVCVCVRARARARARECVHALRTASADRSLRFINIIITIIITIYCNNAVLPGFFQICFAVDNEIFDQIRKRGVMVPRNLQ